MFEASVILPSLQPWASSHLRSSLPRPTPYPEPPKHLEPTLFKLCHEAAEPHKNHFSTSGARTAILTDCTAGRTRTASVNPEGDIRWQALTWRPAARR